MPKPSIYGVNSRESGIYMIKNINDGKLYVGSAKRLVERISNHKYHLKRNKHHSIHLQNAWNKYGENVFIFGVICVVDDLTQLKIIEQSYIDKYRAYDAKYGYNICPMANNNLGSKHRRGVTDKSLRMSGMGNNFYGKKHSEESKYYIGLNNHIRKLTPIQIDEIKKMWSLNLYSQERLAEMFGVTQPHISKIINNKRRKLDNYVPTP